MKLLLRPPFKIMSFHLKIVVSSTYRHFLQRTLLLQWISSSPSSPMNPSNPLTLTSPKTTTLLPTARISTSLAPLYAALAMPPTAAIRRRLPLASLSFAILPSPPTAAARRRRPLASLSFAVLPSPATAAARRRRPLVSTMFV